MLNRSLVVWTSNVSVANDPAGRNGNPMNCEGSNTATVINGRNYMAHALDRMKGRCYTPSVVEDIIQNPTQINLGKNLINQYGLNNLYNKINSIAPRYWPQYNIQPW